MPEGRISFFADCWFLTGATASGKSAVGLELARRIDAEIVSLDSMAVYRGMDIGVAKPTAEDRARAPHHLIDLLDPSEDFNVAQYLDRAEQAVREIFSRGRQALFVGGSPLYLKALLRGLFAGPAADWGLREELEQLAAREGPAYLHRELSAADPAAAAKLHPNDTRRLIRALEVFRRTGQPISSQQRQFHSEQAAANGRVFVLNWPREQLHERIDRRVEEMFTAGLVDEVRKLLADGRPLSRTASQAVGYREVIECLNSRGDFAATIELVKLRTRQLAKRQLTWFRSLSECRWINVDVKLDLLEFARQSLDWDSVQKRPLTPEI